MKTVAEVKGLLSKNREAHKRYYTKLLRAVNALQKLDKEHKRLVKTMRQLEKRLAQLEGAGHRRANKSHE